MNEKTLTQIEAVEAWLQGKQVEYNRCGDWQIIPPRCELRSGWIPNALGGVYSYRLKPTPPVQVPWEGIDDVPAGLIWLRLTKSSMRLPLRIEEIGISMSCGFIEWNKLVDYEWSDASRKVWLPCTKESTPDTK